MERGENERPLHESDGLIRTPHERNEIGEAGIVLGVVRVQLDGATSPTRCLVVSMLAKKQVAHHHMRHWKRWIGAKRPLRKRQSLFKGDLSVGWVPSQGDLAVIGKSHLSECRGE